MDGRGKEIGRGRKERKEKKWERREKRKQHGKKLREDDPCLHCPNLCRK